MPKIPYMEELIFIQNILAIDVINFYLQNYIISPDLYKPPLPHNGGGVIVRCILKNTFSPYWENVKPILQDIKHFLLNKSTFQHLLFHSTSTIK